MLALAQMVAELDLHARCIHDFPECICIRCEKNSVGENGVRCCWEARRGKSYINRTRCAVKACPGFREVRNG